MSTWLWATWLYKVSQITNKKRETKTNTEINKKSNLTLETTKAELRQTNPHWKLKYNKTENKSIKNSNKT